MHHFKDSNLTRHFLILTVFLPRLLFGQSEKQIDRLKELYHKSTSSSDSLDFQKQFFFAFPKSFKEFNNTFGYVTKSTDPEKEEISVLYLESEKYLDLFFRLTIIPDTLFYKKIIDIAIGGHWDADGVNYFQYGLRKKVFANPKMTFDLIKNKVDNDIESFWSFFFQSIHPAYKQIPLELTKMKSYDSRVYGLMEKGLADALKQSGH